jgi:hypothetical protein
MEKYEPLDGRKYNKNNKDRQMGQITSKKIFKKLINIAPLEKKNLVCIIAQCFVDLRILVTQSKM